MALIFLLLLPPRPPSLPASLPVSLSLSTTQQLLHINLWQAAVSVAYRLSSHVHVRLHLRLLHSGQKLSGCGLERASLSQVRTLAIYMRNLTSATTTALQPPAPAGYCCLPPPPCLDIFSSGQLSLKPLRFGRV